MDDKVYGKVFLTITEFSKLVGLPVSTLQYYDKTGVFHPVKRGAEGNRGYRYYSPTQITTIKMIQVLTEIGVPLEEIRDLAENRTPEVMLKLFRKYKGIVTQRVRFFLESDSVIDTYSELIHFGISATETEFAVFDIPARQILLGAVSDYSNTTGFMREFIRFCYAAYDTRLNISYPIGGYWENMAAFLERPSLPPRFFSLDPKGLVCKGAGLYLVGYTRGYYGQVSDLPARMDAFAKEHGLVFSGPVYNQYLLDEISMTDPGQYLLQVSAAVKETRRTLPPRPHFPY